jgi:hypothetical protein
MGANAQIKVPAFTAGQVLTAAEMTQVNTGIPVFATTTTRDAAFGGAGEKVLAEGQFAYIEATDTTQYYNGSSWSGLGGKVAQVVVAQTNTSFSTSSGTYVDVTGLSATITPSATSSTILVMFTANVSANSSNMILSCQLNRNGTAIPGGGTYVSLTNSMFTLANSFQINAMSINYLDSPASTSALTYKIQTFHNGGTVYFFQRSDTSTVSSYGSLVLMEITA